PLAGLAGISHPRPLARTSGPGTVPRARPRHNRGLPTPPPLRGHTGPTAPPGTPMSAPRILLALHRPAADPALAEGRRPAGLQVAVARNMVETWIEARRRAPDAILLVPFGADSTAPEYGSLLALAAAADGPALVIVTDAPEKLPARAAQLADF